MQGLSHDCDLHHGSLRCWILSPLSQARDQTHNLMVPSQICFRYTTMGTPGLPSNPVSTAYLLCDLGEVVCSPLACFLVCRRGVDRRIL